MLAAARSKAALLAGRSASARSLVSAIGHRASVHSRRITSATVPRAIPSSASVQQADQLRQEGKLYLDVRTKEEFAAAHVPDSINVPVFVATPPQGMAPNPTFVQDVEAAIPDKTSEVLVGCAAGKRSAVAVSQLKAAGYANLCDVEGGFNSWVGAGLPVTK
ncbi:unnamed protein product [Pedinophyceae sp. YPF-701]|nr:unnamed protein product [Pedinophyceae sp. YPF-701]